MQQGLELGIDDYLEASRLRMGVTGALSAIFTSCAVLLTPVAAGEPALVGERYTHLGEDVDFRTVAMSTTMGQNLAGVPACTFRAGFDPEGLPVGMQLTAPQGAEGTVADAPRGPLERAVIQGLGLNAQEAGDP